jgi:hypothetical protein
MVEMVLVTLALLIAGVLGLALATRLTARTKHRWTSPASSGQAHVRCLPGPAESTRFGGTSRPLTAAWSTAQRWTTWPPGAP